MLDDAKKFWDALSGKVETACRQETRNAFRCGRYDVTTAPNGTTMGVTLPMGDTELFLPYSQEVASAQVGDAVLVVWWGSMSTARVCFFGDGYRGTSVNGKTGEITLTASDVSAAPAGFGLGELIPTSAILSDLNSRTGMRNGWYLYNSSTLNQPAGSYGGVVLVCSIGNLSASLYQIAFPNGSSHGAYMRMYSAFTSAWTAWDKTLGLTASDLGAVPSGVTTVAKGTFLADTSVFPGSITVKKQGNVIEFYCAFNASTKPTDGVVNGAIADGYRPAAPYAILPMYSGTSPYLQCGTAWFYPGGAIGIYGTPTGTGYIRGTYICA